MLMSHDALGAGPAVLLLHAGVADRRMWQPQVEELVGAHRVVAPDLRGFGETPLQPGPFSYVDDIVDLLDHLGIDRAFVVGSSFGGKVSLDVAAAVPDRVAGLLLLSPAYSGVAATETFDRFDAEEMRLLEVGDVEAAVTLNVETWLGPDAEPAAVDLVARMQRRAFDLQLPTEQWPEPPESTTPPVDLAAIKAPTLVVSGDLDMDHFRAVAAHLADRIAVSRRVTLPWAGHLPSLERPDEVTSLIERYVAELGFLG